MKFLGLFYFKQGSISTYLQAANISFRNLAIPFLIFTITSLLIFLGSFKKEYKKAFALVIIILAFGHIFYFSQKFYSFGEKKYVFPRVFVLEFIKNNQGYSRSWGIGDAYFENNFASQYKFFWPEGYNSLNIRSYAQFTAAMQGMSIDNLVFRADAGIGMGKTDELLKIKSRRIMIDMLGVKYVIAKIDDFQLMEANNFKKVFSDGEFAVFENLQVMPRAFLASNYEGPPHVDSTNKTDKEIKKERRKLIIDKLLSRDFDWRNVLVLEEPSPISAQFGKGSAEIISYKPQEVMIRTRSDQPKLLFLSDNYYPGWKATVDGDETKIWRANYTFRAVPLVPGEHTVRFYYDSQVFRLGLIISTLSLTVLMFFVFSNRKLDARSRVWK